MPRPVHTHTHTHTHTRHTLTLQGPNPHRDPRRLSGLFSPLLRHYRWRSARHGPPWPGAGQGRAEQGRAGQGRAGQGGAGSRVGPNVGSAARRTKRCGSGHAARQGRGGGTVTFVQQLRLITNVVRSAGRCWGRRAESGAHGLNESLRSREQAYSLRRPVLRGPSEARRKSLLLA